ncbi:MAG TPA: tetratricopeptide repeat protein [Acidobacteriaceae bacterium]|nr:tetratricopeptide repeat protein [Acidobacteriaceae bacterium]
MHESDQWQDIARHLPDPNTASPKVLEQQADILRARRFPEDALDFYRYALARGGDQVSLTNKIGLTQLEMKNFDLARAYFSRAVKMNKKSSEAWNNLGAAEFISGAPGTAVSDYKRAIKLDKHSAVYHANLATAYFETKNFSGARKELATAMKLDPEIFNRKEGAGGLEAHVLSSEDRARFSYEMAKLYAQNGLQEQMLHSLAVASEAGMDLARELRKDPVLAKYQNDPRVLVLIQNAQVIRTGRPAPVKDASLVTDYGRYDAPVNY